MVNGTDKKIRFSLPGITSICTTYHHHIPNKAFSHTTISSAQTTAQSKSKIRATNYANVSNAAAHILGKKRVVDVGLDPRWRGEMPTCGTAKNGAHGCWHRGSTGGTVIVGVEVDVQNIQVCVNLRLYYWRIGRKKITWTEGIFYELHK